VARSPETARELPDTLRDLPLTRAGLDRAAHRRAEPGLLPALLADPGTRVLELADGSAEVVTEAGRPRLALRPPVPGDAARLAIFLGLGHRGGPREGGNGRGGERAAYVAVASPQLDTVDTGDARDWRTLRQVGTELDDHDAAVFTTALALANWHAVHTHCPRCGSPTEPALSGWLRRCPEDGSEHYPRTDPAVIMAVVDEQDRLLLARGPQWAQRRYSVLAGFVEPGETLTAAVAREVFEEVGVRVTDVRFLGDQPWPFPSSLMLGCTARARSDELVLQPDEIAEARWVTREELRSELADGSSAIAGRLSIARRLIEHWYGEEITGVP
jgi:NAD+ diphosphatase